MRKILLLLVIIVGVFAFSNNSIFQERLLRHFKILVEYLPQEKVYLHTDKGAYLVGENIWFRAYGVHTLTNEPGVPSSYIYVELIDKRDSLVQRVKIGKRDSCFYGQIVLPKDLQQGEYCLRASTYNMQRLGGDFLFKKKIRVVNPRDSKVETVVRYRKEGRGYTAIVKFLDSNGEPFSRVSVGYTVGRRKNQFSEKRGVTNKEGELEIRVDSSNQTVRLAFGDDGPFLFERYIRVPELSDDFDVQFFPEGGDLLVGNRQRVAFKAIGKDGNPVEITGEILQDSVPIGSFASEHDGMGCFDLAVNREMTFQVLVRTEAGLEKYFDLPRSVLAGWGISVKRKNNRIEYLVMKGEKASLPGELYMVVHSRGMIFDIREVKEVVRGRMDEDLLPEGISQVMLIDSSGHVYSQRMLFVKRANRSRLDVRSDKKRYAARERVELEIGFEENSDALGGTFSLAVTDDGKVESDSLADNILSNLLLTSYLKGTIKNPGYYFNHEGDDVERHLDLVMLTHGWTRFDVEKIARGEFPKEKYEIEIGQVISGQVKNFFGKESKGANIVLLSDHGLYRVVETDDTGRFMIDDVAFPDGCRFLARALNAKGKQNVEIAVDKEKFLLPCYDLPNTLSEKREDERFLEKYGLDYYYADGQKVYVLDEVVVARRKQQESYSFYDRMARYQLDSVRLSEMSGMNMTQLIQQLPGVYLDDTCVMRNNKPMYVLVNDFEEEFVFVRSLPVSALLGISMLDSMEGRMFFGEKGTNGVLLINTKSGVWIPSNPVRTNVMSFRLLGYQEPDEFYVPRYDVDSVRRDNRYDERSTIYWKPVVRVEPGKRTRVSFYTADTYGTYSVILEGVTRDGTVFRQREVLNLK